MHDILIHLHRLLRIHEYVSRVHLLNPLLMQIPNKPMYQRSHLSLSLVAFT